jgi:hypothetical protein
VDPGALADEDEDLVHTGSFVELPIR